MAIKRRLTGYSGFRLDLPHIRSLESAVAADFDDMLRGLVTGLGRPYVIRGFRLKIPNASVPVQTLQIEVADSAILNSTATEPGTILSVPANTPDEILSTQNENVLGAFQNGVVNYVSLDYIRETDNSTVDNTAGWSPAEQLEYQRSAPIGRILKYRLVINTSGHGTRAPLYNIKVGTNGNFEWAEDAREMLFSLGTGGASPNPLNSFNYKNLINPQTGTIREWVNQNSSLPGPRAVAAGAPAAAFDYGDRSITSLRECLAAIYTRFKEISGSDYWYIDSGFTGTGLKLKDVWWDSIGSAMTANGSLSYNMVLEASTPSSGAFQAFPYDPSILPGDSYVEGFTSGAKAVVTNFNNSQLIINSLTGGTFLFDEILRNRRLFRPDLSKYILSDVSYNSSRWGRLRRVALASGPTVDIASWTYNNVSGSDLFYSEVTITTTTPHGFNVGDTVSVFGLTLTSSDPAPNAVFLVESVGSPTTFSVRNPFPLTGVTGVLVSPNNGVRLDALDRHPYMPTFNVASWSYAGLTAKLVVPGHNFVSPVITTGDTNTGSPIITAIPSTAGLKIGMAVSGAGIPAGAVVTSIVSSSSVEISQNATATALAVPITFKDQIMVKGLVATTNAPNGKLAVESLGPGANEINVNLAVTPTGTATVSNAKAMPWAHQFALDVTGSVIEEFNVGGIDAVSISPYSLVYLVGPDTLPGLGNAGGAIQLDGVVAVSTVVNPVRVTTITNDGAGNLTVTTLVPHGLSTNPGPVSFTIYGNPLDSIYIRTYSAVGINVLTPTQFVLVGTGIISVASYTNPSNTHDTFIKFAQNPYAGPVAWDADIVVKGIIGDKLFVIPQTAIAETTATDANVSPIANQFNTNGVTGTVYLRNGDVAYVILKRDKLVSNGASYSTTGGATVVGPTPPVDENGNNLVSGDYVKWEGEEENRWLRIAGVIGTPVVTNSFTLVDDSGQAPSTAHRPAKSGKLKYSKGIYNTIKVKKHWQVDSSGDVYWIAFRRDNGSATSKAYLRNLELELGEVRQVNDNEPSNLLTYTGAGSEAATNPNYSVIQSVGQYQYTQELEVEQVDQKTRMVTFVSGPELNFSKNDRVVKTVGLTTYIFTVKHTISSRTVVFNEDVSNLSPTDEVTYYRLNYNINDSDNLTLGLRKEDRELAKINTALNRPIYDETVFIQQMDLSGTGTIRSGSYIYKGSQDNPTALAWVLHGNAPVVETIETAPITMPGGHVSLGPNSILVHIISGSFNDGDALSQNGVVTSRTVNNPGNPPFTAPSVATNVEIVLPPNRRTQVVGSAYVVFGTHSHYKASNDPNLTGEELLVLYNGIVKQADRDYEETFGGPKAKIRFLQATGGNLYLRSRVLPAYGSAVAAKAGDVTLQSAYNGGRIINLASLLPVEINAANPSIGETALKIAGSIEIDGGASQLGGIFGISDQQFIIGRENNKPKATWTALQAVKTHTSHPGSQVNYKTAAQTVVTNTGTTITGSEITLADNRAIRVKISATVRRSDGTNGTGSFSIEGTFYREGGAPVAAGFPIANSFGASGDALTYSLLFGINGNDIVAVAYGAAGAPTQWALTIEWQSVSLSS
jgi:hypothetical protein